jgi:tRNA U34 5-carboxymethylaminomethyl modifying enzyme MnmG/GidA
VFDIKFWLFTLICSPLPFTTQFLRFQFFKELAHNKSNINILMIQLNNVKTQELIKIKNYQYKTMNIKTRVSIRIQVKYEQYKEKKTLQKLRN